MPLFGRSKKAQDNKKPSQEKQPPATTTEAPKSQPYRHVPKHAASDSRNHTGLSENDREAQQKRIMAASQSRLNSMSSSYATKQNFNVPIHNDPSRPYYSSAPGSERQSSSGGVSGRDFYAAQPQDPANLQQSFQPTQANYAKLRNPSLLSGNTLATNASRSNHTAQKPSTGTVVAFSDSGYGSVGQPSKANSKTPSEISQVSSEPKPSHEVRFAPTVTEHRDFLPKLDFDQETTAPEAAPSEPPASSPATQSRSPTITRDRAISSTSSYISRLDPGSDRRSIASFSSRPFDQVDFSKPGQQILPQTSPRATSFTSWSDGESARFQVPTPKKSERGDEEYSPTPPRGPERSDNIERHDVQKPPSPQFVQPTATPARTQPDVSDAPTQPTEEETSQPASDPRARDTPVMATQIAQQADFASPETNATNVPAEQHVGVSDQRTPELEQKTTHSSLGSQSSRKRREAMASKPEEEAVRHEEPALPQSSDTQSNDRFGKNTQVPAADEVVERQPSREKPASITEQPHETQAKTGRSRNWSRPKRRESTQPEMANEMPRGGVQPDFPALSQYQQPPQREVFPPEGSYETGQRGLAHDMSTKPYVAPTQNEQVAQSQAPASWNDQASSVYPESSHNPSAGQPSPSRRQSYAPSDILESRYLHGRSALPPLSILDGLKVNKRGKILDEEGEAIGELVEGDLIDCVRQRANAFGMVLDEYGRIVGRVTTTGRWSNARAHSPASTLRGRGYSNDLRHYTPQPYAQTNYQHMAPNSPVLGQPFEPFQKEMEDPRQRATDLQAAASRRDGGVETSHIELDASGYAEAAPILDHSEIFAPPFIPSRSPKRSPAEPASHMMDQYFTQREERSVSPPAEETPGLRRWASRNLEPEREEMQRSVREPSPTPAQPPAEPAVSRPTTTEEPAPQPLSTADVRNDPDMAAPQRPITADQPRDNFPWMSNPAPATQETGKWNSALFNFKGDTNTATKRSNTTTTTTTSSERTPNDRPSPANIRSMGAETQEYVPKGPTAAQFAQKSLSMSAGSRPRTGPHRTSYQHQPLVKSPLSTHTITPGVGDSSGSDGDKTPQPQPLSRTTTHTATRSTGSNGTTSTTRKKTYLTHSGRTTVMVPTSEDGPPPLPQNTPSQIVPDHQANEAPNSPLDSAVPPDVLRQPSKLGKKKSRWSMSFGRKGGK